MRSSRFTRAGAAVIALGALAGMAAPAAAQVTYNRNPPTRNNPFYPLPPLPSSDPSAYDQAFDVVPSYQVQTDPYAGGPPVRVVAHCQFPNGLERDATSPGRSTASRPATDHQCPVDAVPVGGRLHSRY